MTKLNTAEIRARADAATKGPWFHDASQMWAVVTTKPNGFGDALVHRPPSMFVEDASETKARMAFIAAARADVPALCTRVEALEAALRETADMLDALVNDDSGSIDDIAAAAAAYTKANRIIVAARAALEGE